ncbi:FitA-like ribbon-helix-helix domain-containing protein [Candidatus Poriferisodalis sp.]|uniref:FitA-like ribbon-helix-helix domain-containing protein n=1 Tax=Candidatus Poriferisodalis sp. TaxID=3101277 RepID=UPI003B528295
MRSLFGAVLMIALQSPRSAQSEVRQPLPGRSGAMASITIRNLDDRIKARLRLRAASRGHSMEEEARQILRTAVESDSAPSDLAASIRARFGSLGGVELSLPPASRCASRLCSARRRCSFSTRTSSRS